VLRHEQTLRYVLDSELTSMAALRRGPSAEAHLLLELRELRSEGKIASAVRTRRGYEISSEPMQVAMPAAPQRSGTSAS